MEYNDNPQQSDAETIQQSGRSQNTERTSITAAPLSVVLQRLGLHPTTRSDEMQSDELLVKALMDEQVAVRTAAIQALEKQGRALPIEPLLALVQHDPIWSVRAMAALSLRGGGDQVPIAPLLLALHDEDESVRAAVVRVLGSMGKRVPLQALQNALYDASWTVREAAMLTLEELEHSVPATVELASLYPDASTPPLPLTPTEVNLLHHQERQEIQAHEPEVNRPNQQHQSTHPGESSHNVATPASRRQHHPLPANRRITNRRISRRAVMVGVATVVVAGNSIIWSLLLRGLHDRQKPQQTITGNKPESISFYGPGYSALDAQGNLYVMDQDLQNTRARILKLSPTGKVLAEWYFQTGAQPTCLAIDEQGNPYVSVQGTKSVYQLTPTGNLLLKWRLTGAQPTGLAFDKQGNLYVASYGNDTIQKYSSAGKLLATWGGPGTNPGQFYNPTAIVVDAQGYIYIADQSNNRIQKLAPTGNPITAWGTPGNGPGQFLQLGAVALDVQGNVYTTDGSSGLVQKFSSIGKLLATWGTTGVGTVQFGVPRGVAVDAQGNIYVSSANATGATFTNGRLIVLSPTGKLLAIWK